MEEGMISFFSADGSPWGAAALEGVLVVEELDDIACGAVLRDEMEWVGCRRLEGGLGFINRCSPSSLCNDGGAAAAI